jgi:ribosomal protein L14
MPLLGDKIVVSIEDTTQTEALKEELFNCGCCTYQKRREETDGSYIRSMTNMCSFKCCR